MAEEPRPGLIVGGRYELIEVAGRGGMADVWRGRVRGDSGFVRDVAIKQMHANLTTQPQYVAMFVEEARVGAVLKSPNVSEVHDFVHDRGHYYMVLEWIEGVDLGSWVKWHVARNEPTRWELVAAVAVGVLRALAAAHERTGPDGAPLPIVHRDVSPHNVLLTTRGVVKLIDFGLAFAPDRAQETTDPGIVKGKMSYLAPEIVTGGRPSPASDQFACGSVLWEALVGRKLFDGSSDYEVYKKVRDGVVQPLRPLRRDVPRELAAVIHRALALDENQRFASTREMAGHLGEVLRTQRAPRDLHGLLAQSVREVRQSLALGRRAPGEEPSATPIAELGDTTQPMVFGELREDPRATPPAGTPAAGQRRARETAMVEPGAKRGLLHKLPFFWKR
jgi:eukaryotic-like serine/threonine-protein kinase